MGETANFYLLDEQNNYDYLEYDSDKQESYSSKLAYGNYKLYWEPDANYTDVKGSSIEPIFIKQITVSATETHDSVTLDAVNIACSIYIDNELYDPDGAHSEMDLYLINSALTTEDYNDYSICKSDICIWVRPNTTYTLFNAGDEGKEITVLEEDINSDIYITRD